MNKLVFLSIVFSAFYAINASADLSYPYHSVNWSNALTVYNTTKTPVTVTCIAEGVLDNNMNTNGQGITPPGGVCTYTKPGTNQPVKNATIIIPGGDSATFTMKADLTGFNYQNTIPKDSPPPVFDVRFAVNGLIYNRVLAIGIIRENTDSVTITAPFNIQTRCVHASTCHTGYYWHPVAVFQGYAEAAAQDSSGQLVRNYFTDKAGKKPVFISGFNLDESTQNGSDLTPKKWVNVLYYRDSEGSSHWVDNSSMNFQIKSHITLHN